MGEEIDSIGLGGRYLPVNPGHGLKIVGRVPIRVNQDETRRTDQVETDASGFRAEEE